MAITYQERVGKAMDLLNAGLRPFIERELKSQYGKYWITKATQGWSQDLKWDDKDTPHLDIALLLKLMWEQWNDTFRKTLGQAERSLVSELRDLRNRWAHQERFTTNDAYRALDSAARLLNAISAPQAAEIESTMNELLRQRFDDQMRSERRKTTGTAIESAAVGAVGLKPWREVVTPHKDVASGKYQQAEFAADLWQVHLGEGGEEYRNPVEFFRRTYLTESLKGLLVGAVRRLGDGGGDPVIQLQTNFGGGKTHSMLALLHLFSGASPTELAGIDAVMTEASVKKVATARRVVLVGNKISPGNPSKKKDGTVVHTLWGELAWQLGGREAYDRIRADDERGTSPGDVLRELFNAHAPCLILIDEWVAYARQLHDQGDLPGGTFETHFSFAQALTESARLAKNCLLVISLPASDTAQSSPHTQADDVEVGGQRGREALDRLRNVIGRVDSSWRPASAEEGFEIVRRRLFEPLSEQAYKSRDVTARSFAELYRSQHQEFPPECREADYEKRIKGAYPIHPEVFDRLYTDWSTLVKFQRTRGVLRLMAAVIHSLWEKGDKNPLILPSNLAIDDPRVQFELTRYLPDHWIPVIEKDVDGPGSLPLRIDGDVPNLGKLSACRRVARTVYLGSAPLADAAHRGLEDRRIKLGCVMPGEVPALFGDALRRLAEMATYLYKDGSRYWYSTQPTVTKLADDRAEQLKSKPDKIVTEIDTRLRADLRKTGDFPRIHPMPHSGQDVPDDQEVRLVVLRVEDAYGKEAASPADVAARAILESRGGAPRIFRNTLVFLAPDRGRMQDLDEAVRKYLAWTSIVDEAQSLDLRPQQQKQARDQRDAADAAVTARIPETWQWLLVPTQSSPQVKEVEWQAVKLASGNEALAVRASKKLRDNGLLLVGLAGTVLRLDLDRVPLWRGDDVSIKQLAEDFARFPYLPRLVNPSVVIGAVRDGVGQMLWEEETFAFADSRDEATGRYRGLRIEPLQRVDSELSGLIVKAEAARRQLDANRPAEAATTPPDAQPDNGKPGTETSRPPEPPQKPGARRFHGEFKLDATRVGRDASRLADEVLVHLSGLTDANVTITLEVTAEVPSGVPPHVVRIVTENLRTLKHLNHGFHSE